MSTKYAYTIHLLPYGATMSAATDDKAKAEFKMGSEFQYYTAIGRGIKAIEFMTFCAACGGEGKVLTCKSKKPSWAHSHKPSCYRRCPDCKGKDSMSVSHDLPSGALAGIAAQTKDLTDNGTLARYGNEW